MAYTSLPTVATGDLWTAANHNTYIKDNFASGVPDIFAAKGDLPVGIGVDQALTLGVGNNASILVPDSAQTTGLKWVNNIAAEYTLASDLSIPDSAYTKVSWDTVAYDAHGVLGSSKFTAPHSGIYRINAQVTYYQSPAQVTATYAIAIYKNGTINRQKNLQQSSTNTVSYRSIDINSLMSLASSDYIEIYAYANNGYTGWKIITSYSSVLYSWFNVKNERPI